MRIDRHAFALHADGLGLEAGRVVVFGVVAARGLTYGIAGVAASILAAATVTGATKLLVARRMTGERGRRTVLPLAYALGTLAAGTGLLAGSPLVTCVMILTAGGCVAFVRSLPIRVASLAGLDG